MARPIRASAFLGLWVLSALSGCGAAAPAGEPARAAPAPPVARAPTPAPVAAAPEAAPASEPAAAPDPAPLAAADAPLPKAPEPGFDFEVWCTDHQVDATLDVDGCMPAKLGDKPDDTLWCVRHVEQKSGVVLYYQGLYLPRGKKLVRTFELQIGAGTIDLPANPSNDIERYLVKLVATPADDHKSVALGDSAERGCDKALAANADKYSRDPKAGKPERDAIERTCTARGRYAWVRGGALRRTGK